MKLCKTTSNVFSTHLFNFYNGILPLLIFIFFMTGCKKEPDVESSEDLPMKSAHMSRNLKEVDIQLIAEDFVSPIGLVDSKDGTNRLFVIDQAGMIWIVDESGTKLPTPFLDISDKLVMLSPGYDERGLLGLAFHPNFENNGRFFVYYKVS